LVTLPGGEKVNTIPPPQNPRYPPHSTTQWKKEEKDMMEKEREELFSQRW